MSAALDNHSLAARRLDKARIDLEAAQHLLAPAREELYDAVGFHAQQCAEKATKALLTHHGIEPPRTHDIEALMQALPTPTPLDVSMADLVELNQYAVDVRYSDDMSMTTEAEARAAVDVARIVWMHARDEMARGA